MTQNQTRDAGTAARSAAQKQVGKVHLGVLMDESGSMYGLREFVVTGCNEFVHEFRSNEEARVWVASFDKYPGEPRVRVHVSGERAAGAADMTIEQYRPRGMTPLNDAVMDMLGILDGAVGEGETAFLAILTDGLENASETKPDAVRAAIEEREKRGWGFIYLGANQSAEAAGAAIGVVNAMNFNASGGGMKAAMRTSRGMARSYGKGGQSVAYAAMASLHSATGGKLADDEPDETP